MDVLGRYLANLNIWFAVSPVIMALLVMFGWFSHSDFLIQLHPSFVPMQFNTALGLLLSGSSFLLLFYSYYRYAVFLSLLVSAFAVVTLSQYMFGVDAGVDQLFMHHYLTVETSHPGRMAPNTGLCFILINVAIIWGALWRDRRSSPIIVTSIGAFVLGLAIIALFGYITGFVSAYGWSSYTRMAVHTSIAFALFGVSLIIFYRPRKHFEESYRHWLLACGAPFAMSSLVLLQVVLDAERRQTHQNILSTDTTALSSLVRNQLREVELIVNSMAVRWIAEGGTSEELWRIDARLYEQELVLFRSLEWIDPTMHVRWVEPLLSNEKAVGLDLSFEPVRKNVLLRSKNENRSLYSPVIELVRTGKAIVVLSPLWVGDRFDGWFRGVVMLRELLRPYVIIAEEKGYALTFYQGNDEVLYLSEGASDVSSPSFSDGFRLSGQEWSLQLNITPKFYELHSTPALLITFILELLLVIAWVWMLRQFFQQQVTENKLSEKTALLNVAVDASSAGFVIHNLQGNLVEVNDAFCRWLGYTNIELIGTNFYDLLAVDERAASVDKFESLAKGEVGSIHREIAFLHKSGKIIWGMLLASRIHNSSGVMELFVNQIIDIEKEKQLSNELKAKNRALKKSNEDLDQFAYVASHDLKSPLNAIQKIAFWLEEDCGEVLPASSREHLELLVSRTKRMVKLLDDLLMYSRVGRYKYEVESFQLKSMVEDIFSLLDGSERFLLNCDDSEMYVPRIPFELVLRNLLSNAIKHHNKEQGNISVTLELLSSQYRVSVADDGPGIPVNMHKKAMEMFQTLKPRDQVEGSGMGLALVKRVIEHYGGKLEIDPNGTPGTTIIVTWPLAMEKNDSCNKINDEQVSA